MAVAKYKQAPGGGNNFSPWVTFTTGAYKGFVNNKTTPDFNGAGVKNPGGGGTSANTSSTSPPVPGCLIGIPIPSGLGFNWNPVGGSFGPNITSSEICLFNRSQARALIGGLLLGTGTLTLFVGTAILVASAFKGNKTAQGAGHGAGTVMEAAGAGLALIPGAEAAGAGVAASGAALRRGGKAGRAGNAAQARKSRRQAGAREDAQLERRVGEPRENPNLRTGRGAIRETPGETRRRRSISPGGQPASRSEAGF
jgi:hypothetical protein